MADPRIIGTVKCIQCETFEIEGKNYYRVWFLDSSGVPVFNRSPKYVAPGADLQIGIGRNSSDTKSNGMAQLRII